MEGRDPRLSVVVPVHDAARYLPECLDSILGQDFRDYEAICVDDGSTDGSRAILADYAARDARIRVLAQGHAGPGAARNLGMESARGKYLYFIDSDDCLMDTGAFSFLVGEMEAHGLDLLCIGASVAFESRALAERRYREAQRYKWQRDYGRAARGMELFRAMAANDNFIGNAWLLCARMDFLRSAGISFPPFCQYEDEVYAFRAFLQAGPASQSGREIYLRRVRERSLTTRGDTFQTIWDGMRAWRIMLEFLAGHDLPEDVGAAVRLHLSRRALEMAGKYRGLPRDEQEKLGRMEDWAGAYARAVLGLEPMFRKLGGAYRFPWHLFRRGERVVLYGAGNVGRDFLGQVQEMGYVELAGVADKRAAGSVLRGVPVRHPGELGGMAYDRVLLAIRDRDLAEDARRDLATLGVPDERIAWDGERYTEEAFCRQVYFPMLERMREGTHGH